MKAFLPLIAFAGLLLVAGCAPQEPPAPPPKSAEQLRREEFFGTEAAADPAVTWRASGLGVKMLAAGTGPAPQLTDRIRLHYTGRLKDGTVFDDTRAKGVPAEFALNRMIPGLVAGVTALKPGGHALFYIPPSLGYGGQRSGNIPPVSGLIFDVELLAVNP